MTKVLIIDDSPTETYRFREILEAEGYEVIEANNGADGIIVARTNSPDVILMDIVMPGMNGFQATRELTKCTETSQIPIIIVSTKDQETDKVWGMRQGAKDYVVKPVNSDYLLSVINKYLHG